MIRILSGFLASFACFGLATAVWADTAFSDGFEAASLDPFWAVSLQNGTITPSTAQAHTGLQSLQMTRITDGQLDLRLTHTFSSPQFGTISVWFYDTGLHHYSYLSLENVALGKSASLGVPDWDSANYHYAAFSDTGGTHGPRSAGWHSFTIRTTITDQTVYLDGELVDSGTNNGTGVDKVTLVTSGPWGSGGYSFDDFTFTPASEGPPIQILSLTGNGQLTWTNIAAWSNGLFSVEWAPSPAGTWKSSWGNLGGLVITGLATTVEVPMFYRVKCYTNLLMALPLDFQSVYGVSNAAGVLSTQRMTMLGRVRPTLNTNEFTAVEKVTTPGNNQGLMLIRSTDSSVYRYAPDTGIETLEHQLGPVGSSWTNYNYEGAFDRKVTLEAIESVTVPAGTFPCYKFHKQALNVPGSDWYEWVCPRIGIVKWVDYWADPGDNPPFTYQLQSFGPRNP